MRYVTLLSTVVLAAIVLFLNVHKRDTASIKPRAAEESRTQVTSEELTNVVLTSPESTDLQIRADDPQGSLSLRGRVLGPDERPVAGAVVAIDATPRRTTTTNADGTFVVEHLLPRAYTVGARSGALASVTRELYLTANFPPITVLLREGPTLEARVLDAGDQHPIEAARVEVEAEGIAATTDRAGKAILEGLTPGRHVVSATGNGYARAYVVVMHRGGHGAGPVLLLLAPGAPVHGHVLDASGAPVEGATVRALLASAVESEETVGAREATSDNTGFWMIPALSAGTFRFQATHSQFAPALSGRAILDGREPAGPFDITVEAGAQLRGRVVTRSGVGVPLALVEARVIGTGIQVGMRRSVFADHDGHFAMGGLPRAALQVEARGDDGVAPAKSVDMTQGEAEVNLVLIADGLIAGSVVDGRGAAIPGAQVVAIPEDRALVAGLTDSRAGRYASAVTSDRGDFRLRGLAAGRYRIRASASRSVQSTQFWLQAGTLADVGDENVRIVAAAGSRLRGKVEWARGGTPDTFTIALTLSSPVSFTGTQGSFVIDDVPSGRQIITAQAQGGVPRQLEEIELRAGEDKDVGRILLESGAKVRGHVIDDKGAPVPEAQILAGDQIYGSGRNPGAATLHTKTDVRGQFALEGVTPGPLTIAAEHATRGRSSPIQIVVEQEPTATVELRLAPVAALEGAVTSQGRPVDRAAVVAAPNGSTTGRFAVTTQSDGFYQFERLAEGDYLVTASLRTSPTVQILQTVVAKVEPGGARADIDVALGGPTVTIDVRDANEKPLANAQIYFASGTVRAATLSQLESSLSARGAGQTRILLLLQGANVSTSDVPPGSYSVCAVPVLGDLNDPAVVQLIRQRAGQLGVSCSPVVVETAPSAQRVSLQVASIAVR